MPASWAGDYIGIPYQQNGESHAGADCYGLARLVLAEQFSIDLPRTSGRASRSDDLRAADTLKPIIPADQISEEAALPGDLVLMAFAGAASHIGVFAGDGYVLHVSEGREAVLERISSPRIARRIEGIYRVQSTPAEKPIQDLPPGNPDR